MRKNKDLKKIKFVRVISLTNSKKTEMYPIIKRRVESSKEIQNIYTIKAKHDVYRLNHNAKNKRKKFEKNIMKYQPVMEEHFTTYKEFDSN